MKRVFFVFVAIIHVTGIHSQDLELVIPTGHTGVIYDIAVSDGRTIGADGRCRDPVGNTVNIENASYTNAIGDAVLGGYWQDPDFDPTRHSFYYVRVIEIPTPRWTTFDAKFFGVERPEDVPASIQERAYTSPIWYTPKN